MVSVQIISMTLELHIVCPFSLCVNFCLLYSKTLYKLCDFIGQSNAMLAKTNVMFRL